MKKERNWSAVCDYLGGGFGQRAFYTRKDWIEQCFEWCYGGMPDEECDEDEEYDVIVQEQREYLVWLNEISDEDLMQYISENWEIGIRETTWLEEGNECYCKTNKGGVMVKILDVPLNSDGELTENGDILVELNGREHMVALSRLYGLTGEICHKCGSPLYVSDLCQYHYVCLHCDENFG
jgi:hypothetical protein